MNNNFTIIGIIFFILSIISCSSHIAVFNGYGNKNNYAIGGEFNQEIFIVGNSSLSYQHWFGKYAKDEVSFYAGIGFSHFAQIQYGVSNLSYKKLKLSSVWSIGQMQRGLFPKGQCDVPSGAIYSIWWQNISIGGFYEIRFYKPIVHSYGLSIGYLFNLADLFKQGRL